MKANLGGGSRGLAVRDDGRALLWIALALLLLTRLTLVLGVPVTQMSDMAWYYGRAVEMLNSGSYSEHGVPTAFWPVGYPAFLAGVLAIGGRSVLAGQVANVALSALCLVLLYKWCVQRFESARVAGVAALLLALYPNHMGYSVGLYSEPLFTALLLGMFLLVQPDAGWARMVAAGVLAGLATLVKAQMLLLGPLLLFLLAWGEWRIAALGPAFARAVLGTLVMAATVAPWTYRNAVVMGAPIPVSTNGGISLLSANNPSMTTGLGYDFRDDDNLVRSARFSVSDQVAADRRAKAAALAWIRENPGTFIALMPKKLFRLWFPDGESEWIFQAGYEFYDAHWVLFRSARVLNQIFYLSVLAAFAWALWRGPRPRGPAEIGVPFMVVFFSLLSMVFSGQSRYHAPLMPFIMGYAGWAWVVWRQRRQA